MAEYQIYHSAYTAQQIENSIGKNPIIGVNGNWWVWDMLTSAYVDSGVSAGGDMSNYAPINSPTFTGAPKAPTPTAGDNSTNIATTAFVAGAISAAITDAIGGGY